MAAGTDDTLPSAQAVLDALPTRIGVVDEHGRLLTANAAWQADAPAPDGEHARRLAAGLRDVLAGRCDMFSMRYPGPVAPMRSWWLARVTRLVNEGPARAVVAHDELGEPLSAEQELEALAHGVSHDLRAPLHAIEGFSRALLQRHAEGLDPQGRHYVERIRAGALQMARLIEGLLALVRISRAELHPQAIDLAVLAREVVAELRAQEPQRELRVEIAPYLAAHGDKDLVMAALRDLLDNAWKFTSRTPQAVIEVGQSADEQGRTYFFVRDNGAGFDMRYAGKLFGNFQRLHSGEEFPGAGLGLARVQRIVARHGGRVWATSEPGVATTLCFTLSADATASRSFADGDRPASTPAGSADSA